MKDMNFDVRGFIAPKTKQDYIALLDEAIEMGKNLNAMWERAFSYANNHREAEPATAL